MGPTFSSMVVVSTSGMSYSSAIRAIARELAIVTAGAWLLTQPIVPVWWSTSITMLLAKVNRSCGWATFII